MNKIEVIQFFIADSAVLFFHVRIISRTPWTNFRYKGYFCRLIGQRQRITYLFAFTPGLCIIQVNGGSYSIKKNVFLIDVIDNIDFGIRIQRLGINIQAVFTSTPVVFTSNAPSSIVCA